MSDTKKPAGWLPPRTGGYVPTRRAGTESSREAGMKAAAPKGGGGVGNLPKRDRKTA
ncbi:hypothetical protein [Rhodococcus sp. 27YEA6]|uniref:hypothetical protein n=1 Tax=Rhodococcus sp. 27YEA6 TaxID=3156273 RepID=UPI003832772B